MNTEMYFKIGGDVRRVNLFLPFRAKEHIECSSKTFKVEGCEHHEIMMEFDDLEVAQNAIVDMARALDMVAISKNTAESIFGGIGCGRLAEYPFKGDKEFREMVYAVHGPISGHVPTEPGGIPAAGEGDGWIPILEKIHDEMIKASAKNIGVSPETFAGWIKAKSKGEGKL